MVKKRDRRRPNRERVRESAQHSYDHRGETGLYGSIYKEDVPEWVPSNDEHEVVLIPYEIQGGKNSLFRNKWNKPFNKQDLKDGELWDYKLTILVHGNVGPNKDNVLCLGTFDQPCPRCEEVATLYEKKTRLEDQDKSTKEIEKLIGGLAKRKRALYNIVCLDSKKERKKGIQLWQAPHASIEDALTEKARNKKTGEIIPYGFPEEGFNIYFEKEGSGLGTKYTAVDLVESDVEDDELDDWYEEAYDLEDIIEVLSYDEFYKKCYGSSPGEDSEEGEETEEEEERSPRGKKGRKKRYQEEDEDEKEEKDSDDNEEEEEEDEKPARKRRNKKVKEDEDEEEEEPKSRSRKRRQKVQEDAKNEKDNDDKPECFGVEFGALEDCEDCDDDLYKQCMLKHKTIGTKKRKRK